MRARLHGGADGETRGRHGMIDCKGARAPPPPEPGVPHPADAPLNPQPRYNRRPHRKVHAFTFTGREPMKRVLLGSFMVLGLALASSAALAAPVLRVIVVDV